MGLDTCVHLHNQEVFYYGFRHKLPVLITCPLFLIFTTATPADVAMLMQLGVDGVFVGSGIFKSSNPERRARAMVQAVTHYKDPKLLAEVSEDLGTPMVRYVYYTEYSNLPFFSQVGIGCDDIKEKWATRESTHDNC